VIDQIAAAYITVGGLTVVNAIGWAISIHRNGKSSSRHQGQQNQQVKDIDERLDSLPCQADPQFQINLGSLINSVNSIDRRLTRIEDSLNNKAETHQD